MANSNLKSKIIEKINRTENVRLLEELYHLLLLDESKFDNIRVPIEQSNKAIQGKKNNSQNKHISDEVVEIEISKWLNQ